MMRGAMMKNKQRIIGIAMAMLITLAGAGSLYALRPPHDSSRGVYCSSCHKVPAKLRGFEPFCVTECHNSINPVAKAKNKALDMKRASNIFGTFTLQSPALKLSHAWSVQPNYSTVGKNNRKAGTSKTISINQVNLRGVSGTSTIICSKCHSAMGYSDSQIAASGGTINKPFVRVSTKGNFICFQCHEERRVSNVRDPLAAGKAYSHPVEVNYSSIRASKPTFFESSPTNIYATDAARLPLYTTYGNVKGAVVCSTCHGPMHSSDSNPYTFDSISAFSMGTYSASSADGRLLRRYGKAKDLNNELCKACHKVTTHMGFNCYRCHTPHKRQGEYNRYLILENISTPYSGKRPVVFLSRSGMAARYQAGYSTTESRSTRPVSNRICQVCHTGRTPSKAITHHRNYSSPSGSVDRTHNMRDEADASKGYLFCPQCHTHTTGFTPSGCSTCHNYPPSDTIASIDSFKHAKHTNASVEPTPTNTFWNTGKVTDSRSDSSYGFSCGRCHSKWERYTATVEGYKGKNHYGLSVALPNYTADIGFKIRTSINSLPWNPSGSYVYDNTNRAQDPGAGSTAMWWGAGTNATCRNLYCHGQWYNGYTSNNPTAKGTQACGKCHGASNTDPPGKTGGNNYGAHPRHVGSANNQQYGSGTPNFRCNACHSLTSKYNNETTVSSRKYHVNGKVNIKFDNGSSSNFRVGNGSSNYGGYPGGYNGYTSRRPAMFTRPAYTTCGLIYCHSRGNRTLGNYSAPNNAGLNPAAPWPNWSSSKNFTTTMNIGGYTMKTRCARCHGNTTYRGITMAMPNYTSNQYGGPKENSHRKHVIENKFRCNICHSSTINSANNSIASTRNHVNRFYNISIISTYRDSGVGNNYDNTNKNCSSVTCHAGKTTPKWGNKIGCPDCHLSNTGDTDKRIKVNNSFQSFSEAAAKIYSTQWADTGHGRNTGSYGSGNQPAAKVCTNCHSASVAHNTPTNPFRLYTAPGRPNRVCEGCHGTNPWVSGGSTKINIQTHASSVVQTGRHNFAIKCIDCHDPHGDNNSRFMVHSTVARPLITGTRAESSLQYGQRQTNVTSSNVDFNQNLYSSDYARKYKAAKICQVCHTRTKNPTTGTEGRFRWYSAGDKAHGSNKCVNCHTHASGFKGAGCDGCHGFPPTGTFNLISMASGAKGKRASKSVTAGAHGRHTTVFGGSATTCSKCHYSGMWGTGSESGNIDLEFRAFQQADPNSNYTGASQKYYGQTAVQNGFYGYSGKGAGAADNTYRCDVKCHGAKGKWLTSSFDTNTAGPRWNDPSTARCGKCHGAKKAQGLGSWPTSNRHQKHAGTSGYGYDFMCRLCHGATVLNTATTLDKTKHVNGEATFKFYTGTFSGNRVWSQSIYTGGDTVVNSGFGRCQNLYCHSRGTTTSTPYTGNALPNYTAEWDKTAESKTGTGKGCSFCHGNKTYNGITSAMPNYTSNQYGGPKVNSHRKHVVENGLRCYYCHSATINSANNGIADTNNHVNKFINVTIIGSFKTGQTMYSSSLSSTNKTCKNVRCHAGKTTPKWGNKIICQNCHLSSSSDTDDFTFNNFSGAAAKIYSTEWTKRGHGKSRSSGKYAFSNNSGAGRTCTDCHKPEVKHNASNNYFRLYTSNPDRLCLNCHGAAGERGSWGMTISNVTGIQSHTWNNISTAGYNGGKIKAASRGGWNFGEHDSVDKKKVKCVDCHDPHGDRNNYMLHSFINMSGSDRVGRPNPKTATAQMQFSTVGGPQMNWSSYVKNTYDGICQRCHSNMMSGTTSIMDNFNKAKYSNHNRTKRCTACHKHKQGFKPSGCDGCHGYPPPNGPISPNNWLEQEASPSMVGLHTPHAKNPRNRPGITAENDVTGAAGFFCKKCHANTNDGSDPTMGNVGNVNAIMTQLTSVYGKWSPGTDGVSDVTDDTCSKITCHTPRTFTRTWKKPSGCNSCHGYQNKPSGTFSDQTTGSHKAHIHYTSQSQPDYKKRKYGFRCTMCHVNNANNYTTHYTGKVNLNFRFGLSTAAVYNRLGNNTSFKGYTTGGELATCSKVYCHGRFVNGTTITQPKWGNKFTGCSNCHKSKANATNMPGAHPLHVKPVASSGYEFVCSRCHARTVVQNTISTLMFNYSSHVNGRKDIYFDSFNYNDGGTLDSAKKCKNLYCHSSGYRPSPAGSFTTRTTLSNWTANWGDGDRNAKTGNRPCSYCHGNKIYKGITAAMPNQTSLWGNSHRTHVIRNNFRCVNCHSATVSSAGTINYAGGRHVDGFKTITIISTYKSGATNYGAGKTCDNVKCHAGKTTPKWGTYITCQNCHLSSTGDTDKRISANNAFQYYTAKTNPTAPKIYSTAWAKVGHGRQSAYSSGNLAANKTCTSCHKAAVAHGTASNRFRLYTINSVTGNPNTLCNDCHGINPGTPADNTGIQTHASSVTQTGRHNFAIKCIDCHDPHGDNNSRFMVHSTVVRPRITGTRAEISNDNGSIFLSATGRNVDFNQNTYTSDYAKKVTAAKICQVCHTRTFKPNSSGKTRFRWNGSNDNSHGTGKCTNCHSHSQGFKGAACNSCHGFPPTSANNLIGRPGTNQVKTMSGSTTAGAHQKHVTVFGSSNDTCNKCHSGGMAFDSNENDDITLKFEAFSLYTGDNQKYNGQNLVRTGFYGYSGDGAGTGSNFTCSSMKCHGAKGSWLTKSFGTPSAPVWNSPGSVFCGSCHGAKKEATKGTWPTTNAHKFHAGTSIRQQDLMCKVCHDATIQNTATTLNYANHINGQANVSFGTTEPRADGSSAYSDPNGATNNSVVGKCTSVYCHSRGTNRVAPYNAAGSFANFTATWNDTRNGYKQANGVKAKCNYCHGNTMSGVTSAMPNYPNDNPKANKHPKHVLEYNFLCNSCHNSVVANNTSIQGGNYSLHVNRSYNVNFNNAPGGRTIENAQGSYTSTGSKCESTYCHSRGVDLVSPFSRITTLANYTAKWGDNRGGTNTGGGSKPNMTRCNYCHGNGAAGGFAAAAPSYANAAPKANRHPKHVTTYGFTCTVCHNKVTTNNTSIDAAGGRDLHVNKTYNINFSKTAPFADNTGTYTYSATSPGSKCKNTYCHSRGTDFTKPYNTRTSFANWTARWGDDRGSYRPAAIGQKAKCNYCHGNRVFGGVTAAMPNYSTVKAKDNTHPIHVRTYGFTCTICHTKVTANNTSIDAAGGTALHVNKAYNVNFKANVRGSLTNNTGVYNGLSSMSKCKNTYCHSRGTDFVKPYNTRTSFANWTARWGDTRGGYKQANGLKAKCNYCHGNRRYSGMTSAMPNYSGTNTTGVTAKANSHRVHVVGNGFVCSTCHYGVVPNNTSISDRTSHVNAFYNISITPSQKLAAGKAYSTNWTNRNAGGTCMNNKCHGTSKPKWGDPSTANCKTCHLGTADINDYAQNNGTKTELSNTEWGNKGHGQFAPFTSTNAVRCYRCHKSSVGHNTASNPYRLYTSDPNVLCLSCHGVSAERSKSWDTDGGMPDAQTYTDIVTHSMSATGGDASWNTHENNIVKCVDCHDPHGDKNRKMIHSFINHSGSDKYGRPAGPTSWNTVNPSAVAMMTFTAHGASGGLLIWSSFANGNSSDASRSICRRCHTPKGNDGNMGNQPSPNFGEQTKTNYAVDHQTHGATCTASCHKHTSGFKGAGESSGQQECKGCHAPLYNAMTSQVNSNMPAYHHVLANTNPTYSNVTLFSGGAARDSARRCLMCHVDHNRFRSDAPFNKTRSKNLRPTARTGGNYTTGINTDFWPAKRTGKYAGTSPVDGPAGMFGVCVSCHKNAQTKNTTFQTNDQGQYATPVFGTTNFIATYTSSSHNFQIITGMSRFFTDGSKFRANCSKCHGSPEYAIQNPQGKGQTGADEKFGMHDSKYLSLNRPLGNITAMPNPLSKQLCFRCHGTAVRGSYDYYSSVQMATGAKLIQTAIEAKPTSNHPVGQYLGHKPDEYSRAATGWNNYINGAGDDVKHIECTDCHNTHGGNASIVRSVGSPNGNRISGAQVGVWGVTTSGLTGPGVDPAYTKRQQVTYQWQVCAKCHTKFAWGSNHPIKAPSQGYGSFASYSVYLTDVIKEFNPKNYGYHPVVTAGKNQPPTWSSGSKLNPNWPNASTGMKWRDAYNNISGFVNISGFDWNFVPPYNRKSTLACSDCHQADSTGKAIASYAPNNVIGFGNWQNASVGSVSDTDSITANSTDTTVLNMDVYNPTSYTSASKVELVVYVKHNGGSAQSITWNVKKAGTSVQTSTFSVAKSSVITKQTVDITTNMGGANGCAGSITPTCLNTDVTIELSESSASVFNVDAAYINATFDMPDALRGPHGSLMQWILASANKQLWVDWNYNDLVDGGNEELNDNIAAGSRSERTFCFNCHRRDVYNFLATTPVYTDKTNNYTYARFSHYQVAAGGGPSDIDGDANFDNKWGIPCMQCHGGAKTGAIHGDWETKWFGYSATTLSRPVGVRLLDGAVGHHEAIPGATGAALGIRCYTLGGALGSCSSTHNTKSLAYSAAYNYSYTSY